MKREIGFTNYLTRRKTKPKVSTDRDLRQQNTHESVGGKSTSSIIDEFGHSRDEFSEHQL